MFDGVSFQYPSASRKVLHDVTLTIRPGEHVALVGANGSGKTTLVKLLCRLYDPTGGAITIDGIDLRDFETAALRREISVVFQDWAAYHVSARDNIWFGDPRPDCDDERIRRAAREFGGRRGHRPARQGLRHRPGEVVRARRRAEHGRVAEDRAGPRFRA